MKNIPIFIALLLPVFATAQNLPYWQDVDVTNVNAETQRTEAVWFSSRAGALSKSFRESENYVDLNGTWDFKYFDDYHEMVRYQGTDWDTIQVPGNWEVQGHGSPSTPTSRTISARRTRSRPCCRRSSPPPSTTGPSPCPTAGRDGRCS